MSGKHWSVVLVLISIISVQGGASIAKTLFGEAGPAGAATLRIALAAIILWIINRTNLLAVSKKQWFELLVYGFSIGAMNLSFYCGINRVPLGVGVTIEFVGPLSLAMLMSRRPLDFLWAILAGLGILLIFDLGGVKQVDLIGAGLVAFAGLMWALYIVMIDRLSRTMKSADSVTIGMIIAAVLVAPFGVGEGNLTALSANAFWMGLGVAVFSSALPFTLDMIALKKLPAKTYSILESLSPAFAALSGLVFLGEALSAIQWLAIAFIIVASVGSTVCAPEKGA
ncbi:MAG: EamA family transporter [Thermoguttaceae bacterium]|nr:EamA family transporter [Thermoguttaceae bacterium]